MIGDLVIFVLLLVIYFRVPRAGVTFFTWVLLYGVLRFAVSFLRLDDEVVPRPAHGAGHRPRHDPAGLAMIIYLLRTPPAAERRARADRRRELREETPPPPPRHRARSRPPVEGYAPTRRRTAASAEEAEAMLRRLQPKIRFELEFVDIECGRRAVPQATGTGFRWSLVDGGR